MKKVLRWENGSGVHGEVEGTVEVLTPLGCLIRSMRALSE
jgi:hypothetical protein